MKKFKICLAANYPQHPQDCVEQCKDCKKFQYEMEHPIKVSEEERKRLEENYNAIIKKAKL